VTAPRRRPPALLRRKKKPQAWNAWPPNIVKAFVSKLWLTFILALLVSCGGNTRSQRASGSNSTTSAPPSSAIEGTITEGPTCPVERVGHPCSPAPVSATVEVIDAAHRIAGTTTSTAEGHFLLQVAPGHYTVVIVTRTLPRCPTTPAHVQPDMRAEVRVACDTGIR
jgi:hypothetical protein